MSTIDLTSTLALVDQMDQAFAALLPQPEQLADDEALHMKSATAGT